MITLSTRAFERDTEKGIGFPCLFLDLLCNLRMLHSLMLEIGRLLNELKITFLTLELEIVCVILLHMVIHRILLLTYLRAVGTLEVSILEADVGRGGHFGIWKGFGSERRWEEGRSSNETH
jgi:hypothetical protein